MTIIINPVPLPPFGGQTYNQITPFTYRDGLTYIEVLESLRAYIRNVLVPHMDEGFDQLEDYVNGAISETQTWTLEAIESLTTYVNDTVQQIINDSIEVQDPVLAGILADTDSESRAYADTIFADKATQETVETGRLSETQLNATFANKSTQDTVETGRLSTQNLSATFEPKFSVSARDYGVVMDGTTDDTEAWRDLFDAVPRGTTVILPPNAEGAGWSLVTDTIEITTDSIRLVGPSSYQYNGGFVFEGANKPMFVIKAGGFQAENVAIIGRSNNGTDPLYGYQVGFDFYGTVLGDIDSQMLNCAVVSMGTAIRTRGRNLTVENTLFAYNAIDWDQAPKTSAYHDTSQFNIIRGLIFRNNRIHSSSTVDTASIHIHDHVDYRHGVIEGNYFDNNCPGVSVKAVGLLATPIRGLNITNNRVFEAFNGLVSLTYCDTPFIHGNELYGTGSALYVFDAITLANCPGAVVMSNLLTRTGRHGIKATTCPDISILNNRMSIVGGGGTVGDGVNWTADCTRGRIQGLSIGGAVGSGIAGKPDQGSASGLSIRSTGPRLSAMTPATTSVPANALHITAGTPTLGNVNFTPVYLLDAADPEGVATVITPPEGATTVALECVYTGMGAAAANVVLQLSYTPPGQPLATTQVGASPAFPVSGVTGVMGVASAFEIDATSGPISVRVTRIASHASDTFTGDLGIVAIRLAQVL